MTQQVEAPEIHTPVTGEELAAVFEEETTHVDLRGSARRIGSRWQYSG